MTVKLTATLLAAAAALILTLAGCSRPSATALPARSGPAYTLMQMNLCLSGLGSCYGRVAYPAVLNEAVARIGQTHPDAVTFNEACRNDVAQIARRTGYHMAFARVIYGGRTSLEVKRAVHDEYNVRVDEANRRMAWGAASVNTWYKNASGRITHSYPHSWPWTFNLAKEDSPFRDIRVRHAINFCVNRDGLVTLLNGLAEPAYGLFKKADPFFGNPKQQYTYDPAKAKALLKEAGYGPDKPVKAKIMISTSGSGQMLPIPMNEYLQQNLKECNFDISFEVVDWGTMLVALRNPPTAPQALGVDAMNISLHISMDISQFALFNLSGNAPPKGRNWPNWKNAEFDAVIERIEKSTDSEEIVANIRKAHEIFVDDPPWLFIVHDRNARAMTKNVKGFTSAQSWFQDFTPVYME